jgi:hypothetical protein
MPFTIDDFLGIFGAYNSAVFPAQIALTFAAYSAVYFVVRGTPCSARAVAVLLSALWIWSGLVYHIMFFSRINGLAYLFGSVFILQGLITFYYGWHRGRSTFESSAKIYGVTGALIVAYALLLYPLTGYIIGHAYPQTPTFGVPCPVAIFTFGIFLWSKERVPGYLLIIPFLWALVGVSAVINMGMIEDMGLPLTAVVTVMLWLRKAHQETVSQTVNSHS